MFLLPYSKTAIARLFAGATFGSANRSALSHIRIHSTTVTTELEVMLDAPMVCAAEAQLLGRSGEELQRFALTSGVNRLPLNNYPAGIYGLRICTDNEVTVKEIIICK